MAKPLDKPLERVATRQTPSQIPGPPSIRRVAAQNQPDPEPTEEEIRAEAVADCDNLSCCSHQGRTAERSRGHAKVCEFLHKYIETPMEVGVPVEILRDTESKSELEPESEVEQSAELETDTEGEGVEKDMGEEEEVKVEEEEEEEEDGMDAAARIYEEAYDPADPTSDSDDDMARPSTSTSR